MFTQKGNVCKFVLQLSENFMHFECKNDIVPSLLLQNQREQFTDNIHRFADVLKHMQMLTNTCGYMFTA